MTKPIKWLCTQRILRSAWASAQSDQSSLSAWRKLGSLVTHWVHREDSDQTGWMPRLIWVFAGHPCHFAGFVMRWLKYKKKSDTRIIYCFNYPKVWTMWFYHRVLCPKDIKAKSKKFCVTPQFLILKGFLGDSPIWTIPYHHHIKILNNKKKKILPTVPVLKFHVTWNTQSYFFFCLRELQTV